MDQSHPANTIPQARQQNSASQTQFSYATNHRTLSGVSSTQGLPLAKNYDIREVLSLVGGSKATHYNRLNPKSRYYDSDYPKPIKNGRLSVYLATEVNGYLAGRVAARDNDP